jgi:hypothetical protein
MSSMIDAPSRGTRFAVELLWILIISFLTLVDAVGFDQNMQLLLKNSTDLIVWVVVLGCSAAAVLLPWSFGAALSSRRRAEGQGLAIALPTTILWLTLVTSMFVVRLTSSPIGAPSANTGFNDPFSNGSVQPASWRDPDRIWVAVFLLVVVSVTFLTASKHSYDLSERRAIRVLRNQRDRLQRQLRRERGASTLEDHIARAAREDRGRLEQAQQIEEELAEAFAAISRDHKVEDISRNLGDPGATEILLSEYHRQDPEMT